MAHHSRGADNLMGWFVLTQIFFVLIQLIGIGRKSDQEKDLEIIILALPTGYGPTKTAITPQANTG